MDERLPKCRNFSCFISVILSISNQSTLSRYGTLQATSPTKSSKRLLVLYDLKRVLSKGNSTREHESFQTPTEKSNGLRLIYCQLRDLDGYDVVWIIRVL